MALRDVTDYLQLLLRKSGHHLHTSAEREIVRTIKEKTCYVAANVLKEDKELMGKTEEFRLPDGKVIQVSNCGAGCSIVSSWLIGSGFQLGSERYWAPEILFNPELIGSEDPGVPQVSMIFSLIRIVVDATCFEDHHRLPESCGSRFEERPIQQHSSKWRLDALQGHVCAFYHAQTSIR